MLAKLGKLFNEKIDDVQTLLEKIKPWVPSNVRESIDEQLKFINAKRQAMSDGLQKFAQPVRTVLKVVAKKLDDHAWHVEIHRTNRGWIAPLSESGAAKLINAAPPKWVIKRPKNMKFPPMKLSRSQLKKLMRRHPNHPPLEEWLVRTFSVSAVSYTHLRAHETGRNLVCRLLLEKKNT